MSSERSHFGVMAFGLAFACWWGLSVLVLGVCAWFFGYGSHFVEFLSGFYVGYAANFVGVVVGTVWAVVDGFISGVVFAWFYNFFSRCCHRG